MSGEGRSPMAVIGIGNPMMGDDGIGPRLILELESSNIDADLIDMGTGGMQLVHLMAEYRSVILIDSAEMGLYPGESRIFSPEEVVSFKETRAYSLHDWDLLRSIQISRDLGEAPDRILILAIQPGSLGMGEDLSPTLKEKIPHYLAEIRDVVEQL